MREKKEKGGGVFSSHEEGSRVWDRGGWRRKDTRRETGGKEFRGAFYRCQETERGGTPYVLLTIKEVRICEHGHWRAHPIHRGN